MPIAQGEQLKYGDAHDVCMITLPCRFQTHIYRELTLKPIPSLAAPYGSLKRRIALACSPSSLSELGQNVNVEGL